jgi:hypothetical protein
MTMPLQPDELTRLVDHDWISGTRLLVSKFVIAFWLEK